MRKTLYLLMSACCFLSAAILASPVRSSLGGDKVATIEDGEVPNLWVWPTDYIGLSFAGPKAPHNWQPGIWYLRVADNGYTTAPSEGYSFSDNSFHNMCGGGYSMVQFFALEEGEYSISYDYLCETPTDNADLLVREYIDYGAGWVYGGAIRTYLVWREVFEDRKSEQKTFTIPAATMVYICITGYNSVGRRGCDVWNVVLNKID